MNSTFQDLDYDVDPHDIDPPAGKQYQRPYSAEDVMLDQEIATDRLVRDVDALIRVLTTELVTARRAKSAAFRLALRDQLNGTETAVNLLNARDQVSLLDSKLSAAKQLLSIEQYYASLRIAAACVVRADAFVPLIESAKKRLDRAAAGKFDDDVAPFKWANDQPDLVRKYQVDEVNLGRGQSMEMEKAAKYRTKAASLRQANLTLFTAEGVR